MVNSMRKALQKIIACASMLAIMGAMMYNSVVTTTAAEATQQQDIVEKKRNTQNTQPTVATVVASCTAETKEKKVEAETPLYQIPEQMTALQGSENTTGYIVETPYDKSIFVENGLEFHYVAGDTWQGLMTIVKDPSRVFVGMPRDSYTGAAGANATRIAQRYNAMFAVNGAFFVDTDLHGNGGTPIGFVFSEGRQTYGGSGSVYNLMGLDNNNQFVCEAMTGAQAVERGIRDAVTCNPILVQNGQVGNLSTKSTTLMDARTAVGARADGCILILVVDGRMSHSIGATTRDLADCMISFGAVSAGNLDGGGSISMYYTGTPFQGISSVYGNRAVPNAICVRPE